MKLLIAGMFIILFFCLGCGCSETESERSTREFSQWKQKQAIEACVRCGGIPIYSSWDGRLVDCRFRK